MKKTTFLLLLLIITSALSAQNETNNWFFGSGSGLTFSSGSPVSITTGALTTNEGSTSASDPITGNLLFYSDGTNVWDNTNTIMPSGTGLFGNSSSTMSALAVPLPGSTDIYYIFTTDCIENSGANGFNYSIVDMTAHGGLGDVTSLNNPLFSPCGEVNHAVKHANCVDYWVVARETLNNNFRAYLLTSAGVSAPVITSIGVTATVMAYGQGKFSPDGSKFAVADGAGGTLQIFDFNTTTGVFSNPTTLYNGFGGFGETYGLSFSPDNTKLYAGIGTAADSVNQWDVSSGVAATMIASRTYIATISFYSQMQMGKDYKIYIANPGSSTISVINNPNLAGTACDLVSGAITISGTSSLGLTAFPESDFNSATPCSLIPHIYSQGKNLKCYNDSSGKAWVLLSAITPPHTITWSPGGMTTDTITGLAAGTYYTSVTDSAGIIYVDTVTISQPPMLTASIYTPDDSVCPGTSVTLSATGGGGTGTYTYLWNTSAGTGSSGTYTYTPAANDSVSLTITDVNSCVADTQLRITILSLQDPAITPVPTQCVSAPPITLAAASSGGTWSGTGITDAANGIFSPTAAGTGDHIITYTLTRPCLSVDTVTIHVVRQLSAAITSPGSFCTAFAPVALVAADAGGVWSGVGITNPTTGMFDPALAGVGSHLIKYTIDTLCGDVDSITLVVVASPVISFTVDTTEGCEPTVVVFTSVTDQPDGSCFWDFGDGNTSTDCNPTNSFQVANTYSVTFTYTNTTGCSSSSTQNDLITVHSQPLAVYSADPQPTTIVNPIIHFTDHSSGLINDWHWSFGTHDTSILQNPTYTYADTGAFPIHFIVTNNFGCTDTAVGTIMIDPILLLYAPNAFTPDGNGINDVFTVKGDGIDFSTFEMRIFNRWGELIYRTEDINKGWNGAANNTGELLKQDEYVWKVNFNDFANIKRNYIGRVLLVK